MQVFEHKLGKAGDVMLLFMWRSRQPSYRAFFLQTCRYQVKLLWWDSLFDHSFFFSVEGSNQFRNY